MAVPSTMLPLGTPIPAFCLRDAVSGRSVSSSDLKGQPLLVMFICNGCPFVVHLRDELTRLVTRYLERGVAVVAINANSLVSHPEDGPVHMRELARKLDWRFPFLFDESQETAKAFRAACTPDFFLFDKGLVYRGRFDDSRPSADRPVTGADLRDALERILAGQTPSTQQTPSIGCNIKWAPGNEPSYYGTRLG
jgi:thiol-disulfide isomerase/thioredoxin